LLRFARNDKDWVFQNAQPLSNHHFEAWHLFPINSSAKKWSAILSRLPINPRQYWLRTESLKNNRSESENSP
jgi:hypothetical protein